MKTGGELEELITLYLHGFFDNYIPLTFHKEIKIELPMQFALRFRSHDPYTLIDNKGLACLEVADKAARIMIEHEDLYVNRYNHPTHYSHCYTSFDYDLPQYIEPSRECIFKKRRSDLITYRYFTKLDIKILMRPGGNYILYKGQEREFISFSEWIEELEDRLVDDEFKVYLIEFKKLKTPESESSWVQLYLVDNTDYPVRLRKS